METKLDIEYLNEFDTELLDDEYISLEDEIEYSNFDKNIITIEENEFNTEEFFISIDKNYFNIIYDFEKCIKEKDHIIDLNEVLCGTVFIFDKKLTYYLFEEEVEEEQEFIFLFEDNNDYIYFDEKKSKILISRDRLLCEKYVQMNNENFNQSNYLNKLKNIIIIYNFEIDRKRLSIKDALFNMEKNIDFMKEH